MRKIFLQILSGALLLAGLFFGLVVLALLSDDKGGTAAPCVLTIAFLWGAYRCWSSVKTPKPPINNSVHSTILVAEKNESSQEINGLDHHDFLIFKKLANQVIADDKVDVDEALALQSFLYKNGGYEDDRTHDILTIVDNVLADGHIDKRESQELTIILGEFLDNIDKPAPAPKPIIQSRSEPIDVSNLGLNELIDNRTLAGRIQPRKAYFITYTDSKGDTTEREIFVSSIKTNKAGNDIVYSRCKSAGATRSFRLDRIDEAIDIETGELVIY